MDQQLRREKEKSTHNLSDRDIRDRRQKFLKSFPNFTIQRGTEKRFPLAVMSQQDPQNFFTCKPSWQICSFDFTFRKIITDTIAFKVKKFRVVDDYFYGVNDRSMTYPEPMLGQLESTPIKSFNELIVYRGYHICTSQTFMNYLPRMFNNKSQDVQDKLLNYDIFKITKIRHPERYEKFLNHFKERVKRFAHKDYVKRRETKEIAMEKGARTERNRGPQGGGGIDIPEAATAHPSTSSRRQ